VPHTKNPGRMSVFTLFYERCDKETCKREVEIYLFNVDYFVMYSEHLRP
jgi:hypothetical protein